MIGEFLKLRGSIYRLLARPFYLESTVEYLNGLRNYFHVFKDIAVLYESSVEEAIDLLDKSTANITEDLIDSHEKAFARLFLSVGYSEGIKSIIPVESVYLSGNHLLMQEQWEQVLEYYYNNKVRTQNFSEPEDHLTAEFHFMAVLCDYAAAAKDGELEQLLEAQEQFLDAHILKWVNLVCDDLYNMAQNVKCDGYFKGIAVLAKWFIHADRIFLEKLRTVGVVS